MLPHKYYKPASPDPAQPDRNGLMSAGDKKKLDGVLEGASRLATPALDGLMSAGDKTKLNLYGPNGDVITSVTAPLVLANKVLSIPEATSGAAGHMPASAVTKLSGIATGATANDTNANLRDRATHTGTQAIATLSDGNKLVQGTNASGVTAVSNINTITKSGFYDLLSGGTGGPTTGAYFVIHTQNQGLSGYASQLAVPAGVSGSTDLWVRTQFNNTWGAWRNYADIGVRVAGMTATADVTRTGISNGWAPVQADNAATDLAATWNYQAGESYMVAFLVRSFHAAQPAGTLYYVGVNAPAPLGSLSVLAGGDNLYDYTYNGVYFLTPTTASGSATVTLNMFLTNTGDRRYLQTRYIYVYRLR